MDYSLRVVMSGFSGIYLSLIGEQRRSYSVVMVILEKEVGDVYVDLLSKVPAKP